MKFASGLPETVCGCGSTMESTAHLRAELPGLLQRLGIARLLDAPCGDLNWMAHVDLSGIDYVGCDNDPESLHRAIKTMAKPNRSFYTLDIRIDRLPAAHAMLCRDFLQHLPNMQVIAVLCNFLSSGIRWLLATSHDNPENDDIGRAGLFRPLNLLAAPFSFAKAESIIADPPGSGRILGAWNRDAIAKALTA
jgi:hypothetical protein